MNVLINFNTIYFPLLFIFGYTSSMKLINTIIAITFSSVIVNTALATPHQKLAMLSSTKSLANFSDNKVSKKVSSRKKRYRGSSCLRNVETVRQKAQKINSLIIRSSQKYAVDANLIKAVIAVESCYNRHAVSPAGARGLMQLIPATADRFGVSDSFDARQNINAGTKYLRFLLDRFDGDLKKATAGYNAGEGKVDRYNGIPPYKETRNYVKNVLRIFNALTGTQNIVSSTVDERLVNRDAASYKGMSAEKRAILNRIRSLGVKSAYHNTKRPIAKRQQVAKPPKVRVVYKSTLKVKKYKKPRSNGLSPKKLSALNRLKALQKKLRMIRSRARANTGR